MKIYVGDPKDNHTVEEGIQLAPGWDEFWMTRYEHGWTFTSAGGTRFALDCGCTGWMAIANDAGRLETYRLLGDTVAELYIDKEVNYEA